MVEISKARLGAVASPRPAPPAAAPGPAPAGGVGTTGHGFVARLGGVSVVELIQFECLRGEKRILRVSSRGQSGYLYFRGGALVHAATAISVGVAAVREMLAWRAGSIESGIGTWPTRETIEAPWQDVLMEAADLDEQAGATPGNTLRATLLRARALSQAAAEARAWDGKRRSARPTTVVLAPSGQLLAGDTADGLPEAAAYAAHMAELIGNFLGFDRFCALEASYGGEQLLVGRRKGGNLVARRERNPVDLEDLRREIGEAAAAGAEAAR